MENNSWVKIFEKLDREGGELSFTATKGEIERFKTSTTWTDISNQLITLLVAARDELEIMGEGVDRNAISYLQGQCYAIKDLLSLPDTLINNLQKEGEDEPEKPDDR